MSQMRINPAMIMAAAAARLATTGIVINKPPAMIEPPTRHRKASVRFRGRSHNLGTKRPDCEAGIKNRMREMHHAGDGLQISAARKSVYRNASADPAKAARW